MKKIFFWENPMYLKVKNNCSVEFPGIACYPSFSINSTEFRDFCNGDRDYVEDYTFIQSSFLRLFRNEDFSEIVMEDFFEKIYSFYSADAWVINFSLESFSVHNDLHMLTFVNFLLKKGVDPNSILIVGDSTARIRKHEVESSVQSLCKDFTLENIYLSTERDYRKTLLNKKVLSLLD